MCVIEKLICVEILDVLQALRKEVQEIYSNDIRSITSLALTNERRKRNHEMIIQRVNEIFEDTRETYYIPAGRSLLTVMLSNRAMMNSATNLDLITDEMKTASWSVKAVAQFRF